MAGYKLPLLCTSRCIQCSSKPYLSVQAGDAQHGTDLLGPKSSRTNGSHILGEASQDRVTHSSSLRKFFSEQLMHPEWLTDVPADLGHAWCALWYYASHDAVSAWEGCVDGNFVRQACACRLALPRPEGQRCLVIAQRQKTIARTRAGSIFQTFASCLPGGSHSAGASPDAFSILDAVYSQSTGTFYVLDMMAWNGYLLYDCSAEFRCFWMQSKLIEADDPHLGGPRFVPVPVYPCSPGEYVHGIFNFL